MICQSECFTSQRDYHWLWILLPLGLVIVFLLYIFSRPNYARVRAHTYQLIKPTKNVISLHPQKQHNDAFDQYAKYSTPTSLSSEFLFERQKEKNNSLVHLDNTKHKTTHELNTANVLTSPDVLNHRSLNNSNETTIKLWNGIRTPVLANYPDFIDATENPQIENQPLLSNDIWTLINGGFEESDLYPNDIDLGRIWFFLEYNSYLKQLYLTIIKVRNLRSIPHCQPTTFVRAEIVPKLNVNFSTDVIHENANPDYMTETIFDIKLAEFPRNVLKLTVYEIEKDVFHIPFGTTYYPLDHLLIAQRVKGHAIWRNLLSDYGDPSAIGLIQIRATVSYGPKDEYLNIYVHSLRAMGIVKEVYHVYVHAAVAIHDFPVIPEEHIESSQIVKSPFTHEKLFS